MLEGDVLGRKSTADHSVELESICTSEFDVPSAIISDMWCLFSRRRLVMPVPDEVETVCRRVAFRSLFGRCLCRVGD